MNFQTFIGETHPDPDFAMRDFDQLCNLAENYAAYKSKEYAKAKLQEAAERATIWVETPINGTEFESVERNLSECDSSTSAEPFIERISVFKESITNTPL